MITSEDLSILSTDEYKEETIKFNIKEKDSTNKFIMDLSVKLTEEKVYNIFCKKTTGNKSTDNSKMLFLSFLNFPDGVYLEIEDDQIKCHIFELKKSPVSSEKLNKISKQFMSAKFHIMSLFSIMELDMDKIEYKYYVVYVNDVGKRDLFNLSRPPKVVPGERLNHPRHIEDWLKSKLKFNLGKYIFDESFSKILLDELDVENGFDVYKKEITLQ